MVWIKDGYGFGGRRMCEGYVHGERLEMAGATRIELWHPVMVKLYD